MLYTGAGARLCNMHATHVRALTDGRIFLEHGADLLRPLAVEPYCRTCHALGLAATVTVRTDAPRFEWRCAHRSGWVAKDKPLDLGELLHALSWDLRCTACGYPVEAANAHTDTEFRISCPCTLRHMANPLAAMAPAPSGPHPVGDVDSSTPVR